MAIRHAEFCSQLGCDGILVVTPYYNKGTKRGIIKHYTLIAEHSSSPIILYNVPSRTGVNLGIDVLRELSQIPMINALKEASDSINRLVEISTLADSLNLYAGNDTQIYPTLALGGKGVISAVSNVYPKEINDICKLFFANKQKCSLKLQQRMFEAINVLFTETNPTPIKYAMWKKGYCKNELRLPLYPAAPSTEKMIDTVMEELDSVNFK